MSIIVRVAQCVTALVRVGVVFSNATRMGLA
jgi:hypothetical protein